MKNILKFPILALALVALAFTACKKDEKTPEELLSGTTCWKLQSTDFYDSTTSTWVNEPLEDCDKDDCTNFKAGGTLEISAGTVKCDPTDDDVITGTWALSSDGKTLTITQDGFPLVGTISELTESKLAFEYDVFGEKGRVVFTN